MGTGHELRLSSGGRVSPNPYRAHVTPIPRDRGPVRAQSPAASLHASRAKSPRAQPPRGRIPEDRPVLRGENDEQTEYDSIGRGGDHPRSDLWCKGVYNGEDIPHFRERLLNKYDLLGK